MFSIAREFSETVSRDEQVSTATSHQNMAEYLAHSNNAGNTCRSIDSKKHFLSHLFEFIVSICIYLYIFLCTYICVYTYISVCGFVHSTLLFSPQKRVCKRHCGWIALKFRTLRQTLDLPWLEALRDLQLRAWPAGVKASRVTFHYCRLCPQGSLTSTLPIWIGFIHLMLRLIWP